jgi:branched-chain amino acid transport system substrate-binding protein
MRFQGWLKMAAAVAAGTLGMLAFAQTSTQTQEVKVGLIVPLSGPFARQGELMLQGAQLAVAHINETGGIKALGGAKLKLIVADTGDSTEKAKNAAQRLVADNPGIVGISGAWSSSFTLAVTEVTERAGIPFVTQSFADQITARGFKYVLQTSAPAGVQAKSALAAILNVSKLASAPAPRKMAVIRDNTASPTGLMNSIQQSGELQKLGLEVVADEVFTPPMADASSAVQKLRNARPDVLLLLPTVMSDDKLVLERMNETGLGEGRLPTVASGAHMAAPEMLKLVGPELLENTFVIVANWQAKGLEDVVADYHKKTGEPWMPQESVSTYGDMVFFKEAVEQAGSIDRQRVMASMRALRNKAPVARFYAGHTLEFDETGKRLGASVMVLQWQQGQPRLVYPESAAEAKPRWPSRAG